MFLKLTIRVSAMRLFFSLMKGQTELVLVAAKPLPTGIIFARKVRSLNGAPLVQAPALLAKIKTILERIAKDILAYLSWPSMTK
jgi:hypothetical protein